MPPEDSALERMQKRLYRPDADADALAPSELAQKRAPVSRGWKPEPLPDMPHPKKKLPLTVKFFIAAIAFFVLAGAVAAYFLFLGGRSVSTDNINISVDGPTNVAGGDTVSLLITVENHNPVQITDADFSVDFPEGTRSADDQTRALSIYDENLGTLAAGQAVTRTIRAALFGADHQTLTIPVKLEYRTDGSNSVFVKEQDYVITIGTSPVSVTASSVSQISSGQPITFSVSVRSNATQPLSDIALSAQYPFGFSVSSTSVPSSNGLFPVGKLEPGQEKKITITGTLTGQDSDKRVFHWNAGSTASSTNGSLGVSYASAESDVMITKPFLGLALSLNGDSSETPVIAPGDDVQGLIGWTNSLSGPIANGKITVRISGSALDEKSVRAQNGFYQSSNGTITFDKGTDSDLGNLAPGDTGTGTFSFSTKTGSALADIQNPTITFSVSASGSRTSESGVPETLSATVSRSVKIATSLSLSSHIVHSTGPFENMGPVPPTVGTPTTYTVVLDASNGASTVAGASATMTLPSYVTYTGLANPSGSVSYNDSSRKITWNIGDMAANASREAAFQISFLPSVSQSGSQPTLVSTQTITATDRFTQKTVSAAASSLTTDAKSDPDHHSGDGTVR